MYTRLRNDTGPETAEGFDSARYVPCLRHEREKFSPGSTLLTLRVRLCFPPSFKRKINLTPIRPCGRFPLVPAPPIAEKKSKWRPYADLTRSTHEALCYARYYEQEEEEEEETAVVAATAVMVVTVQGGSTKRRGRELERK